MGFRDASIQRGDVADGADAARLVEHRGQRRRREQAVGLQVVAPAGDGLLGGDGRRPAVALAALETPREATAVHDDVRAGPPGGRAAT
jgi:hypothetical protein